MADRPTGRQKNVTEGKGGVQVGGPVKTDGPVGAGSSFHGSSGGQRPQREERPQGTTHRAPVRGGLSMGMIILIAIVFIAMRSCGGFSSMESYDSGDSTYTQQPDTGSQGSVQTQSQTPASQGTDLTSTLLSTLLGGGASYSSATNYGDWQDTSYQTGKLDTTVASGAREKRTVIKGDGTDKNVILIYMCGTDLESRNGMASRDMAEMAKATLNDHVKIYIYTGGCKRWQTSGISDSANQIYEIANGGLKCLDSNRGNGAMVKSDTLVDFLTWAKANTSGNRYDLIFWDHGGGSVSGYGYDEKNKSAGSMNLANIGKALKVGGLTYDFIGFDACLMATVETGLVVSDYADYMIASEETEPGVGWYYTTWLTELAKNPGMPTVEMGKIIVDTYTQVCAQSAAGQQTTLSVVDLAELSLTVPDSLKEFAGATSQLIQSDNYQTVSDARSGAREFGASSKIDQVDLVHLAKNMGTAEGDKLAEALLGAVKYNQTSRSMTNSYGLSVYFPMKRSSSVDSMVNTYEAIGMDEDYTRMIQQAASMNVYGQVAAGGTGSPYGSLFGESASGGSDTADALTQLLTTFLSSDFSSVEGLSASNTAFLGKGVDPAAAAQYIAGHSFPADELVWQEDESGNHVICLDENAWSMANELVLNMYYDIGYGYVDLGLDNVYEFDDNGNLLAPTDRTWVSVEGLPVAYYYVNQTGSTITGYMPALLNDEQVNLLVVFDDEHPNGHITGANYDYKDRDISVIAKNLTELNPGDEITFLCDTYNYSGEYEGSRTIGSAITVPEDGMDAIMISNTDVGDGKVRMLYRITDMYGENYWTQPIEG